MNKKMIVSIGLIVLLIMIRPNNTGEIWDKISEERIKKLHPKIRDAARKFINNALSQGIKLRIHLRRYFLNT